MRQAGRYLPEYRELRGDRDILETIRTPEQAVEVTLQPLRRMPVDAAILFSDIVVPLVAVGVPIRIEAGRGPVLDDPFRADVDLARLRPLEPEADEPYVLETVRLLVKELQVPLIGFAGAPFTLASYLIEGGPSRDHARTKVAHDPESGFDYGRHWWMWPQFPGSLSCHGYQGQFTIVVPDKELVVVHLGITPIEVAPVLRRRLSDLVETY